MNAIFDKYTPDIMFYNRCMKICVKPPQLIIFQYYNFVCVYLIQKNTMLVCVYNNIFNRKYSLL